jgi:hypothetical protein
MLARLVHAIKQCILCIKRTHNGKLYVCLSVSLDCPTVSSPKLLDGFRWMSTSGVLNLYKTWGRIHPLLSTHGHRGYKWGQFIENATNLGLSQTSSYISTTQQLYFINLLFLFIVRVKLNKPYLSWAATTLHYIHGYKQIYAPWEPLVDTKICRRT